MFLVSKRGPIPSVTSELKSGLYSLSCVRSIFEKSGCGLHFPVFRLWDKSSPRGCLVRNCSASSMNILQQQSRHSVKSYAYSIFQKCAHGVDSLYVWRMFALHDYAMFGLNDVIMFLYCIHTYERYTSDCAVLATCSGRGWPSCALDNIQAIQTPSVTLRLCNAWEM